jgi:hypothetical protein
VPSCLFPSGFRAKTLRVSYFPHTCYMSCPSHPSDLITPIICCVVDLRHVKEPYEHDRCSSAKLSGHVSHPCFICFATRCLLALLTDVPGGRIKVTRIRLIVGLIIPHRTYLTLMKPVREAKARFRAVVPLLLLLLMMIICVEL